MKNLILSIAALVLFVACQSAPQPVTEAAPAATSPPTPVEAPAVTPEPVLEVADPSNVVAGAAGFSPLASSPANFLAFSLHFGKPDQVVDWSVEFVGPSGLVARTLAGDATQMVPTLTWDGTMEGGAVAPEGVYQARLTVNHGSELGTEGVHSEPFLVDITPPTGTIVVTPQPYAPGDPDHLLDSPTVTFELNLVPGAAPISTWRLFVLHPDGRRFMDFIDEDHNDNRIVWNGRAENNASLEGGVVYDLDAEVYDRYGNRGTLRASMEVAPTPALPAPEPMAEATPVTVTIDGALVASLRIYFPAYSADLSRTSEAKAALNREALTTLAEALQKTGSRIRIIGHANQVLWQDPVKAKVEQEEVLLPLSKARAESVRNALVERGLEEGLFEVTGVGAENPAAPFGDLTNNWKNRRVEFVVGQ